MSTAIIGSGICLALARLSSPRQPLAVLRHHRSRQSGSQMIRQRHRFAPRKLLRLCGTSLLSAADFSSYRGMKFGMGIADAAKLAGDKTADAKIVHQRPALIQELDWQPRPTGAANSFLKTDSVREGMLSFYNGELSRIVITYDRYQIEGLTAQDIIDGISAVYGTASTSAALVRYATIYGDTTPALAHWEDPDYSWNLIRTGDKSSFS